MNIVEPYIPKEHLALQINYCRQQLAQFPKVLLTQRAVNGKMKNVYRVSSHTYLTTGKTGTKMKEMLSKREAVECELSRLEGLWNSSFRGPPPTDIEPRRIIRHLYKTDEDAVKLNSDFFESLKNDANPFHPENKKYPYNGIMYRSIAERDIARVYTENRIPFKYEPEIQLKGVPYTIYPDFVLLIKELDLCKFHEHFGMMSSSNYVRDTNSKYTNYSNAGLIPGFDIIYTYGPEDIPFDTRMLNTTLNSVVYNSLFAMDIFN